MTLKLAKIKKNSLIFVLLSILSGTEMKIVQINTNHYLNLKFIYAYANVIFIFLHKKHCVICDILKSNYNINIKLSFRIKRFINKIDCFLHELAKFDELLQNKYLIYDYTKKSQLKV